MKKATHQGSCQICGRAQKLPNGNLSLHGYTTRWGFFNGVCPGSRNLPFEVSKDLIEGAIANAQRSLAATRQESSDLKAGQPADTNNPAKVWFKVYDRNLGQSFWQKVTLLATPDGVATSTGLPAYDYHYVVDGVDKKTSITSTHSLWTKTFEQASLKLNSEYAQHHLDARASQLAQYIAWQQERIANWQPVALKPVA